MNSVIDILECLNSDEEKIEKGNVDSIVLLPPKDGEITDEDSDKENEANLKHLTPSQLQSKAEVIYKSYETSEKTVQTTKKYVKKWNKTEVFERDINLPDPLEALNTSGCTIIEAWEAVFNDEIVSLIINMPNKYAMQKILN